MNRSKTEALFEQVVQKFAPQSKLLHTWELKGGVSAQITALQMEDATGHTKKMIIRQHREKDLQRNQQRAADEFKLLRLLHTVGVAAPLPYALDQSGEIFSTPYLVMEYIEGETLFASSHVPFLLLQFATHLSRLHQIESSKLDVSFLPRLETSVSDLLRERPTHLNDAFNEERIRALLETCWPLPQRNTSALLHGDFWPGNVLWKSEQLVALIDWEDDTIGDPLADVANSRLEILWAFGVDAMLHFTQQYQSMNPLDFTHLPYWDLYAALRPIAHIAEWGLDTTVEKTMREKQTWFVTQALEKCLPL